MSFDSSCYYWYSVTKCCYTCEFAVSRVFHFRFVSVVPNVAYCWAWFALAQIRCVCRFVVAGLCFCCCSSLLCVSCILSGIMTFKPLKSKRTNTTNDQSNRRGLAEEHNSSPPTQKKSKVMPPCARLDICIYKVTDKAGNCWSRFEDSAVPLWQVAL